MFKVIYLVDATEPINFLVGPLFFLYIVSKVDERKIKKPLIHFLPSMFYLFYSIFYHIQSIELKYNSYIDQYHPQLNYVAVPNLYLNDPLSIKTLVNELTIISIFAYLIASIIILYNAEKNYSENSGRKKLFRFLWVDIALMTVILTLLIFVKAYFAHDLGDYIIITAICVFIYATSFKIIRDSVFFQNEDSNRKYRKSGLDEKIKEQILGKIDDLMESKYYLNPSPSLPDLAKKINTSPNYVSQVINEKLNLTFLEMINKYRIEDAKEMILNPDLNETVEGIAYLVGFNSKSTFHSAFKKFTGKNPFRV
jgi:AraC-like DNA-binding protein